MKTKEISVDDVLICPLTGDIMTEPVIDPEGNTYQKSAILHWLSEKAVSPMTNSPLSPDQLVPNRALRDLLEQGAYGKGQPSVDSPSGRDKPPPPVGLELEALHSPSTNQAMVRVHVSDNIIASDVGSTVVLVIDESGSMDSAATMHDDKEGASGLSVLDLVKHASRTVIETLGCHDRLALVTFADTAKLVLPITNMTAENRKKALNKVDGLCTWGSTNLYDGLVAALDLVRLADEPLANANIFLLTDGVPNIHPPRGDLPSLIRYKESHPSLRCRISTFGFGYTLDSKLLHDIAEVGKGHYCFIPDGSFIGTVFVNATANVLTTVLPESTLQLKWSEEDSLRPVECLSGQSAIQTIWGLSIDLPSLISGQTLDILLRLEDTRDPPPTVHSGFHAMLRPPEAGEVSPFSGLETTSVPVPPGSEQDIALATATIRSGLVRLVKETHQRDLQVAQKLVEETKQCARNLLDRLSETVAPGPAFATFEAIQKDMEGQIAEAYSRGDWYKKWGRHYVLSLSRAHSLQQCSNFKDPGLQTYATRKFSDIRDASEAVFCKLPPPKPSRRNMTRGNYRAVTSMRTYYNSSGPCFAAGSVKMADGSRVSVDMIRPGDVVWTPSGPSEVGCVVVTECEQGATEMVPLQDGVLATPWHPVRVPGSVAWDFPCNLAPSTGCEVSRVYSFVLENRAPYLQIGPYEVVTLGHGITNDAVAEHGYLGSQKVLDDLSQMEGWKDGYIVLGPNPAIRDAVTNKISRLQQIPSNTINQNNKDVPGCGAWNPSWAAIAVNMAIDTQGDFIRS